MLLYKENEAGVIVIVARECLFNAEQKCTEGFKGEDEENKGSIDNEIMSSH